MPLPENKACTPFKTMDIKTALLASANRKRKASSPQKPKIDTKSLKLSVESSEGENDVKIIDEACGITITVDQSEFESNHVECKENKDLNTAEVVISSLDCSDNKLLNSVKDDLSSHKNTVACNGTLNSKSSEPVSDMDLDQLSEKSKHSDNSSCDESNYVNVSMNTSGLSITGEDDEKVNNSPGSDAKNVSNNSIGKEMKTDESNRAKKKKMTPAEAQKKAEEREQKNKERMLKKQELENKKKERQLEKELKLREKQLRKEREEMERKERERLKQEKKEQEEKERLQKQKEKEEKLKQKMEEKKKKEEMRLKKEEEMRKAEEEKLKAKLEKEQKERERKERARAAFAKFFQKKDTNNTTTAAQQVPEKGGAFLPFQVSDDMILAPVIPAAAQERFNKEQLDQYLEQQDGKELYLDILKSGSYKDVRQRKKNRKLAASDADIIVIDKKAQAELGLCPKLLQFSENVRPPYWGTWRRKSKNIRPRNPFGQDEIFDYDVDSDDEWDEGGPGESLSGTEDEKEEESEDDYEVDNEFFVPHGYLSDEEEKKEDDDEEVNDPEKQKALLKLKLQEFEKERKKKTTELKPIILGCYFMNDPSFQDSGLHGFLEVFTAVFLTDSPIPTSFNKSQPSDTAVNTSESPSSSSVKKKKILLVPEEAFPDLIRLVHGNTKNRKVLAEVFQKFWLEQFGETQETKTEADKLLSNPVPDASQEIVNDLPSDSAQISLRQLNHTIREIASYGKPPDTSFNKCCWWVNDEVRKKYGLMDAPIPNQWNYVSQKDPELSAKANGPTIKEFLSHNVEK